MNGPKVVPRKEERDSNKTAPMQILYYRGTFRKLSPNMFLKTAFYTVILQLCHAGQDSNRYASPGKKKLNDMS